VSLSSGDEVPHIFTRKSRLRPKEFLISGAKRFLQNLPFMHVLPAGFHRIRYYGLLASGKRAENIDRARELLKLPVLPVDAIKAANTTADEPQTAKHTLRGSHDHHRALRARLNSAPPANSANASDQDRYLVIMSTQSPSLNAGHFVVAARLNTSQARANSLFVHQFSLNRRFRGSKMITAAPAPCVTPCNLSTSRLAHQSMKWHVPRSIPHS